MTELKREVEIQIDHSVGYYYLNDIWIITGTNLQS